MKLKSSNHIFISFCSKHYLSYSALSLGNVKKDRLYAGPF